MEKTAESVQMPTKTNYPASQRNYNKQICLASE
jgi:hypothetical protein